MKILVIGAGAVGTYCGAALAMAGHEVTFGVRNSCRRNLTLEGLELTGPLGDFHVRNVSHTADPASVTGMDIVLSTVKLYDATSSARQWRVALEASEIAISLQDGVDGVERMRTCAPNTNVIAGLASTAGTSVSPGRVKYPCDTFSLTVGTAPSGQHTEVRRLVESIGNERNPLKIAIDQVQDIEQAQWRRFLALATHAALTCLIRLGAGAIYHDPALIEVARRSIRTLNKMNEGAVNPR